MEVGMGEVVVGCSTGATAAIATVIPLVFLVGALATFLLWKRKKSRKAALLAEKGLRNEKAKRLSRSLDSTAQHPPTYTSTAEGTSGTAAAYAIGPSHHETPEWTVEMDATEAERQKLVGAYQSPISASTEGHGSDTAELGGVARVPRKLIAPVEIDSTELRAEVGDAYMSYRPSADGI